MIDLPDNFQNIHFRLNWIPNIFIIWKTISFNILKKYKNTKPDIFRPRSLMSESDSLAVTVKAMIISHFPKTRSNPST